MRDPPLKGRQTVGASGMQIPFPLSSPRDDSPPMKEEGRLQTSRRGSILCRVVNKKRNTRPKKRRGLLLLISAGGGGRASERTVHDARVHLPLPHDLLRHSFLRARHLVLLLPQAARACHRLSLLFLQEGVLPPSLLFSRVLILFSLLTSSSPRSPVLLRGNSISVIVQFSLSQ